MTKKLKIGVIGCSQIAYTSVIPAIKKSKLVDLEIIGSRDLKKAKSFATKFNSKKFGFYEDVIENKEVDVVYISLPIGLHEKWTVKAAKANKHILCEKSSTTSVRSAKKMIESVKKNHVRLMEGLMFKFHPSHEKIIKLINEKTIGDVFTFYGRYGFPSISKKNIRYDKKLGGGILNDAACYPISASRLIFQNNPKSVYCSFNIEPKTMIDEQVSLNLEYENNQNAQIVCGYNLLYQNFYSIWGQKGSIRLERAYNIPPKMKPVLTLETSKGRNKQKLESANHFVLMIDKFCNEINKNEGGIDFEKDLMIQARILEAARISAKKNRIVKLSEIS